MQFKVGDKVILGENYRWVTSGKVIRRCVVKDCYVVRLTNGIERHMFHHQFSPALTKNQQLLFRFMEK